MLSYLMNVVLYNIIIHFISIVFMPGRILITNVLKFIKVTDKSEQKFA